MKILLDTHILIWIHEASPKLTEYAIDLIKNPKNTVYFSTINIWETEIKNKKNPNEFTLTGEMLLSLSLQAGFKCLDIKTNHALALKTLHYSNEAPQKHSDPFDRMLLCQAKTENMLLMTHDELIPYYNEKCVIKV